MRTIKAVLSGFLVASALILAAEWAHSLLAASAMRGEYYTLSPFTALLTLVYTSGSTVAGAYVASRIHDSWETTSGFVVAQAFFGFGFIREFWSTGSSWYTVAAVLLVIPCAFLGRALARRFGRTSVARAA
jgi:uncharacterized membrane protein